MALLFGGKRALIAWFVGTRQCQQVGVRLCLLLSPTPTHTFKYECEKLNFQWIALFIYKYCTVLFTCVVFFLVFFLFSFFPPSALLPFVNSLPIGAFSLSFWFDERKILLFWCTSHDKYSKIHWLLTSCGSGKIVLYSNMRFFRRGTASNNFNKTWIILIKLIKGILRG